MSTESGTGAGEDSGPDVDTQSSPGGVLGGAPSGGHGSARGRGARSNARGRGARGRARSGIVGGSDCEARGLVGDDNVADSLTVDGAEPEDSSLGKRSRKPPERYDPPGKAKKK